MIEGLSISGPDNYFGSFNLYSDLYLYWRSCIGYHRRRAEALFLICGGLSIVFIGINKVGGWDELIKWTPQENIMYTTAVENPGYPAVGVDGDFHHHRGILHDAPGRAAKMPGCKKHEWNQADHAGLRVGAATIRMPIYRYSGADCKSAG
jgi:hypothetical protein